MDDKKSTLNNLTATRRKSRLDGLHRAQIEESKAKDEIKASTEDAGAGK
jgi:hypothetical protein